MRIFERDQVSGILSTVVEGISYAGTAPGEAAAPVIGDCLEALTMIAEFLTGTLSPARAKIYGELILPVKALLEDFSKDSCGEALIKLGEIQRELETESEIKIKVAFFPYKASMWDALESIWLAARDDPRCETDVVPIRYAARRPDGSVLRIHCERDGFPAYVPVLPVEGYDLEKERPDIAYIHNPYDGNNLVTSVEQDYYSHELKKHVGTLVYVPYYVSNVITPEHLAQIACVSAADVIVARAEEDADVFKNAGPGRDVPALGSPKIDRILRYERERPEAPPEWCEKLLNKKVFLLNTSVSTLLREDTGFSGKMNRIFSIFESRDDIALLWRPHPLSEATMNSMRPEQLAGYRGLIDRIKAGSFGVLDETADVTRAIALSDAYMGEGSTSLIYMYAITGKPVYIMDFTLTRELTDTAWDEFLRAAWTGAPLPEEGGETALCLCFDTNEICRIYMDTGRVCPAAELPGVSVFETMPYITIADCGDRYILPPFFSDRFIEFDKNLNFIRAVELPERAKAEGVFSYTVKRGKYVYFMPGRSAAIARYNTSSGEYEYFYDWYERFKKYAEERDAGIFSVFFRMVENKVYLPCYKDNIIAELNLDTMDIKTRRVGASKNRYFSIDYDGKYFWLTKFRPPGSSEMSWRDGLVRWDPKTGKSESFDRLPKSYEPGYMGFRRVVFCGSYLLVFPMYGNMILKAELKNGKMTPFGDGLITDPKQSGVILPDPKNVVFDWAERTGGTKVIGTMSRERALLRVDVKTGETKKLPLCFDSERRAGERLKPEKFAVHKYDKQSRGIFIERPLFPPENFIEAVISGGIPPRNGELAEFYLAMAANSDGSCGERTHGYIIKKSGFRGESESNETV